jgi:hypothetical protein
MLGSLTVEDTAFFAEVIKQITVFHKAILEPGSFFLRFSRLLPLLSVPDDFPV